MHDQNLQKTTVYNTRNFYCLFLKQKCMIKAYKQNSRHTSTIVLFILFVQERKNADMKCHTTKSATKYMYEMTVRC